MSSGRWVGHWALALGLGAWSVAGRAQDPAQAPAAGDLTKAYRFIEHYTSEPPEKAPRGAVGQAQVAYRSTISRTREEGSSNRREEVVYQVRYSERPAQINPGDARIVQARVRRYEAARVAGTHGSSFPVVDALAGLTIWSQAQGDSPRDLIVSLSAGRRITDQQYKFDDGQPSFSDLAFVLPEQPIRIGDTWQVDRLGAAELVDSDIVDGVLTGKLASVRPAPKGGGQVAVLEISGRVTTADESELAHRSQVHFAFTPTAPAAGEPTVGGAVEAPGGIVRVSLADVKAMPGVPGRSPRVSLRREFVLERRIPGEGTPLMIPEPPPAPTPENSWLLYDLDEAKRFRFLHPQELQVVEDERIPRDVVLLQNGSPDDTSSVRLEYLPKPTTRPEAILRGQVDHLKTLGAEVIAGNPEALPAADWPGRTVQHLEISVAGAGGAAAGAEGGGRTHLDSYVIQFPQGAAVVGVATTVRDPGALRKQAEAILKTVQLGAAPRTTSERR